MYILTSSANCQSSYPGTHKLWFLLVCVCVVNTLLVAPDYAADPPHYDVIDLGVVDENTERAFATRLNEAGQVVGIFEDTNRMGLLIPFIWGNGTMIPLIDEWIDDRRLTPKGINNRKRVAGSDKHVDYDCEFRQTFLWNPGDEFQLWDNTLDINDVYDIDELGHILIAAKDINDCWQGNAYVYDVVSGKLVQLPGLNDNPEKGEAPLGINNLGEIVGRAEREFSNNTRAVIWRNGTIEDLGLINFNCTAWDINDAGQIIVSEGSEPAVGIIYVQNPDGSRTELDPSTFNAFNSDWGSPRINNAGEIVIFESGGGPWLWRDSELFELEKQINYLGPWDLVKVYDINDSGHIVGYAYNYDVKSHRAVMLVPTDELRVSSPIPGLAGRNNEFRVYNGTPDSEILFVYSLAGDIGGESNVPGCPGLTVPFNNPRIAGSAITDAQGYATLNKYVSSRASGRTFQIVAVDRTACEVSRVVTRHIP